MFLLGILLLIIGIWLLIYIKITSLITINYRRKTNFANHFAVIIKYQNNFNLLSKLLQSINNQTRKLDIDIYLFCDTLISINDYKIILVKNSFFKEIRNLNKLYDGYFVLNSNTMINKNYFKDLKKDISNNYDIIYTGNNYYFKNSILDNNLVPYLENEEELKYYKVYYNLKTINNKTLVYNYHPFKVKNKINYFKIVFTSYKKYIPLIRKSLKYKLPNHYERFKICFLKYAYFLIVLGMVLIFIKIIKV